tara:strand:- start:1179 stop:1502 length:324 start_codon:yes stop_codon:yes gene_type:complete
MSKVTDNVELDFPARMSDGRGFTDYRQNCTLNNSLAKNMGSWEYRNYLTTNAEQIHGQFMSTLELDYKCTKCTDNTVLPVKTILNCSTESCTYQLNDSNGLGQGRQY